MSCVQSRFWAKYACSELPEAQTLLGYVNKAHDKRSFNKVPNTVFYVSRIDLASARWSRPSKAGRVKNRLYVIARRYCLRDASTSVGRMIDGK